MQNIGELTADDPAYALQQNVATKKTNFKKHGRTKENLQISSQLDKNADALNILKYFYKTKSH